MGDWAYATAITVWAYQEGGATAVGVFQAVRFVAMAVAGPLGAVVADRVPRKTFMLVTDLTRAVLVAVAAVSISLDGPAVVVYVLGVVAAMVGAPFRSAQAGLIPRLVSAPDELTASNAVAVQPREHGDVRRPGARCPADRRHRRRDRLLGERGARTSGPSCWSLRSGCPPASRTERAGGRGRAREGSSRR